jgi:hypothetical protein
MCRSQLVAFVLTSLSLALAGPAHAVLITVNFTVTADPTDPVNSGATANGSFSFDSSIIPPGGGGLAEPIPTVAGFNLTWDGTSWDDATTSFGAIDGNPVLNGMHFDSSGNMTNWVVFSDPGGVLPSDPDHFRIFAFGGSGEFQYHNFGTADGFIGTVTWSTTTGSVPEPSSWMLLGAGFLGMMGVVRRIRPA